MDDELLAPHAALVGDALRTTWTSASGERLGHACIAVGVTQRHGARTTSKRWVPSRDSSGASTLCDSCDVTICWQPERGGYLLLATLSNVGSTTVALEDFELELSALSSFWPTDARVSGTHIAYCGAHSRSASSRSYVIPLETDTTVDSWWVGAVSGAHGPGIVCGGAAPTRFVTSIRVRRDSLCACFPLEGWTLHAGESVTLDPVWIGATGDAPHAALERFADVLGSAQHARLGASPSGWGSWGHWLERIDAGLMREMVHAIDGSEALRRVINVVQIDDGWSELLESRRVSASWRPNSRFPSGLAPLAAEIAQTGRRCGLWLLPFTLNAGSPIVETRPEWLVQDADGVPMRIGGSDAFCLDPTHPGGAAWITALLERFRDWGVDYVKLDFLRALLAPDPTDPHDNFRVIRRYHGAKTRLEAYRIGLSVIRRALGDDTTIVACSAPAAAGVGIVDCHRVGPDIERQWTGKFAGVLDAARAVATNWFWHGRTWVNDPDYLLACESEALTRFWASVVALSGGSVVLSADLSTLAPWAESMLAFVMPPIGRAARPLDLFSSGPDPRRWALPFERGAEEWTMLGLFNWSERPVTERVSTRELGFADAVHVWDAWRLRHTIASHDIDMPLEAQSAALLRLTPVTAQPTVVGTDVHWAQGWHEFARIWFEEESGRLTLDVTRDCPRDGHAWVWVPPDWSLVHGGASATEDGLVTLQLTPGRTTEAIFRRASVASLLLRSSP